MYVTFRPYVFEFLDFVMEMFELVVFTKGCEMYCSAVLDSLEARKKYFAHRVYNDHVLFENVNFTVKHYDFLFSGLRTTDNTLILDCCPATYTLKLYSGLPVCPYNPKLPMADTELVSIAKCLEEISSQPSVIFYISGKVRDMLNNRPSPKA